MLAVGDSNPSAPASAAPKPLRYPSDFSHDAVTTDGTPLRLRSIQPGDVPLLARFHATLSDDTVRSRYFHQVGLHARIADARLARICRPDPAVEAVLVAILHPDDPERQQIVGVGRLEEMNGRTGEVAVVVSDRWQRHGIGRVLLDQLIRLARQKGLAELHAYTLSDNVAMQRLCQRAGFDVGFSMAAGTMKARLAL